MQMMGQGGGAAQKDAPVMDTAETIQISSLSLLKMLKHCRAGVPMEVMGLMLGEFVDEYTIRVVDVFAMPQTGSSTSVEAVDHVFQTDMLEMLKATGRHQMVVGWYHSHPGWGCWLSSVDMNTQQSFEQLNERAVALVVDPVQSVRGKVILDSFRLINPQMAMLGKEPRQTTSNLGSLKRPSLQALMHGLNRHYYVLNSAYRKNELEEKMLKSMKKPEWVHGLRTEKFEDHTKQNEKRLKKMYELAKVYNERLTEEAKLSAEELKTANVGKLDPRKRLQAEVDNALKSNIVQTLGTMMSTKVF